MKPFLPRLSSRPSVTAEMRHDSCVLKVSFHKSKVAIAGSKALFTLYEANTERQYDMIAVEIVTDLLHFCISLIKSRKVCIFHCVSLCVLFF